MKSNNRHTIHAISFVVGILLLSALYQYYEVANYGPISLHRWRQSDSASIALCYYEEGMHFFQPRSHNVFNDNPAGVGEFPIMYYLAAGLYHIFGPENVILRILDFLVFCLGLYLLSRLLLKLSDRLIFSLAMPLFLFGSPVVAFYSFNYTPNVVGLGFTLGAFYFFYRMVQEKKQKWWVLTTLFFLLGALIKVTTFVPFLALFGTALVIHFHPGWKKNYRKYFPPFPRLVLMAITIIVLITAWYLWANNYNKQSGLMLTKIRPIWEMSEESILATYHQIKGEYHKLYFNSYILLLTVVLAFVNLLSFRILPKELYLFYWLNILGTIGVLILFFDQILVHHYYFIDISPSVLLTYILFFWVLKIRFPKITKAWPIQLALIALVLFTWWDARENHVLPYYQPDHPDVSPVNPSLFKQKELQLFLSEKGIKFGEDLVYTAPDITPNVNLYYLNLRGWSEFAIAPFSDETVKHMAQRGANYLVLTDTAYIRKAPASTQTPIGVFDGSIYFYDLSTLPDE